MDSQEGQNLHELNSNERNKTYSYMQGKGASAKGASFPLKICINSWSDEIKDNLQNQIHESVGIYSKEKIMSAIEATKLMKKIKVTKMTFEDALWKIRAAIYEAGIKESKKEAKTPHERGVRMARAEGFLLVNNWLTIGGVVVLASHTTRSSSSSHGQKKII